MTWILNNHVTENDTSLSERDRSLSRKLGKFIKMGFPTFSGILFCMLLYAVSSTFTSNSERLEDEVRNQKNRIVVLEEKNSFLEGETKELKIIVEYMRTELDHVNAGLTKNFNFRDRIHNQYDASLPHANETFKRKKRPASQLVPLQLFSRDDPKNIGDDKFPSSCSDLNLMGHTLNRIYLTKLEKNSNKIAAVFCDFRPASLTGCVGGSCSVNTGKLIGYLDIKSTPGVYFYVQRNMAIGHTNKPEVICFNIERLNIGRAFNITTGVFTAPKPGIYQFSFSFLKDAYTISYIQIHLRLNNKTIIGKAFSGNGFYASLVSFQSVLRLKKGDRIDLFKKEGTLNYHEDYLHHFSGLLLEEDFPIDFL